MKSMSNLFDTFLKRRRKKRREAGWPPFSSYLMKPEY